jgi:hypothetical protein
MIPTLASSDHAVASIVNLADERMLGGLLDRVRASYGAYELLGHHQQGEFHHTYSYACPHREAICRVSILWSQRIAMAASKKCCALPSP